MQQIIITLVALLGMIIPIAGGRLVKLFRRFVPLMPMAGRVGASTPISSTGEQRDSAADVPPYASRPGARALHLRMRRLRRAFRAAA